MNQLQRCFVITIKTLVNAPDASEATMQVLSHGVPSDAEFEVLAVEQDKWEQPDI